MARPRSAWGEAGGVGAVVDDLVCIPSAAGLVFGGESINGYRRAVGMSESVRNSGLSPQERVIGDVPA
jgi:hypothetical protein